MLTPTQATSVFLLSLTLTACTVVPGSHLGRSAFLFSDTSPEYVDASTEIDFIQLNSTAYAPPHAEEDTSVVAAQREQLKADIDSYEYKIGPGDVLTITVWEHPELTIPAGSFRSAAEGGNEVKSDGTIFYPYVGNLEVAGRTTAEIKAILESRLSTVIKRPQVDVRVADFQSKKVYVTGAVVQPGVLPLTKVPLTLIDAIEQRGGLAADAAWESVLLTRGAKKELISLQAIYQDGFVAGNRLLENGDVIHINRNDANKIFVLGEVNRPSSLFMSRNGTTLAEALAEANGINESKADGRGIYVLRNVGIDRDRQGEPVYKAQVFHLNASSAVGFMLADNFNLQARDVVYVSSAPIARWNRFISQLLPSILATENIQDVQNN